MMKSLISIVTPCFNEEANVDELYKRIKATISQIDKYDFQIIFIDNASTDKTVDKLRSIARLDETVKIIINTRNFGHIRSPYYGILQSQGVATIYLASDLQDPPELIPEFIRYWENGFKLVMAVKPRSQLSWITNIVRKKYYRLLDRISDVDIIHDSTGFGLYDESVLNQLRKIDDPYPFLRGLVCELGYKVKTIEFMQPRRSHGITKNNFYSLYDIAMLGIVSHSKLPLRLASFFGLFIGFLSFIVAITFFVLKLCYWNLFPVGYAPVMIVIFMMFGALFMFIGLLGEYILSIHTYVKNRPIVVESERVNFD